MMKNFLFFFAISLLYSCDEKKLSESQLELWETKKGLVIRFDQIIANLDQKNLEKQCAVSPQFCEIYFSQVLAIEHKLFSPNFYKDLNQFRKDSFIVSTQKMVNKKFQNLNEISTQSAQLIGGLKTLFPDYKFGHIYTFTSGFSYQAFIFSEDSKDALGIGLDMFLYPDLNYKNLDPKNPVFADYLSQTYTSKYIVTKLADLIADDLIPTLSNQQRMIDYMIRNGKKLYLIEQLLPEKEGHFVADFVKDQYQWCINNEKDTWGFFLEKELLYETDMRKINKFINPSPDAPGMPKQAPGRTANFIGWQIIKSYMKRNPEVGIQELINNRDAQDILQKSKYKPIH